MVTQLIYKAYDATKSAAMTTSVMGLNAAIVSTQIGFIASAAAASVLLDGAILTKNAGAAALATGVSLEKALEARIYAAIEKSRNLAKIPVEKFTDHANAFLDIANAVVDNYLHLPIEDDAEKPDSSVAQRITRLCHRIIGALRTRAHETIVEPSQRQLTNTLQQLQKSLTLHCLLGLYAAQMWLANLSTDFSDSEDESWATFQVDALKKRREELSTSMSTVLSKMEPGHLSESLTELWTKIESEAREYKITPEEALIRSVRHCSHILNGYIQAIREKGSEVFPTIAVQHFNNAASYVEHLDSTFEKAKDIFEVKDEVLEEAKKKLTEILNIFGVHQTLDTPNAANGSAAHQ